MSIGVSITTRGLAENIRAISMLPAAANSAAAKGLAVAGIESGNKLRQLLNMPKRTDGFWGVMGTTSPFGLALRTGGTRSAVIATGQVFGSGDSLYTFVAHPMQHVADLEDGAVKTGNFWIPTAAAQTPGGADRAPGNARMKMAAFPGAFMWPTKRMKNFKNGPPQNKWIVRRDGKRLVLLYMHRSTVTLRAHHTFAAMREQMLPRYAEIADAIGSQIVKAA